MLGGRPTVFLSCSEKYKTSVAMPVREELSRHGVHAVIVSEEPQPTGAADWEPDDQVEYFLNGSDALVALCTPDDHLDDGTIQSRQTSLASVHARNRTSETKSRS
jgi:hypothetical protein